LFVDLKQGMVVKNSILDHKGRSYLISGTPVMRDPDIVGSEIVGSLLIGVRLERLFGDFKTQNDDDSKQVELALVRNLQVTASAAEASKWDDIARATRPEARETVDEGGQVSTVLRMNDKRYDYFVAQLNGYEGVAAGSVGQLFLLRNRVSREALF